MKTLFDGERAFQHIKKLAVDIGARPGGSKEDQEAAKYIKSYFEELGLETSVQEFEINTGYTTHQSLEVTQPYHESIPCEGMSLIGQTGKQGITGELVHIETTDEEYLTPVSDNWKDSHNKRSKKKKHRKNSRAEASRFHLNRELPESTTQALLGAVPTR